MSLSDLAKRNLEAAWATLGARPGPGIDIIFRPDIPVSRWFTIVPQTFAGQAFLRLVANGQERVRTGHDHRVLRQRAEEFGLRWENDWSQVVKVMHD